MDPERASTAATTVAESALEISGLTAASKR